MNTKALRAAFAASARERVRYPGDAAGYAVFLALILFTFTQLWTTAAKGSGGTIGGYLPASLVLYLLVTEIVTLAPGAVHLGIAARVRSGDLATDLLRPVDWVPWELARAAGSSAVRMGIMAAAGFPALALLVDVPHVDPRGVAIGLAVLVPLAIVLDCSVRILIGLCAFWFEEAGPFYWIWQKLCFTLGGLMLPVDLYPDWLRTIAACLPFQALLFAPAKTVVDFDPSAALAAAAQIVAWIAVAWLLLALVAGRGARRLQLNGG